MQSSLRLRITWQAFDVSAGSSQAIGTYVQSENFPRRLDAPGLSGELWPGNKRNPKSTKFAMSASASVSGDLAQAQAELDALGEEQGIWQSALCKPGVKLC